MGGWLLGHLVCPIFFSLWTLWQPQWGTRSGNRAQVESFLRKSWSICEIVPEDSNKRKNLPAPKLSHFSGFDCSVGDGLSGWDKRHFCLVSEARLSSLWWRKRGKRQKCLILLQLQGTPLKHLQHIPFITLYVRTFRYALHVLSTFFWSNKVCCSCICVSPTKLRVPYKRSPL